MQVILSYRYTIWCPKCGFAHTHKWIKGQYECETCGELVTESIKDQLSPEDKVKIAEEFRKLVESGEMESFKAKQIPGIEIIRRELVEVAQAQL